MQIWIIKFVLCKYKTRVCVFKLTHFLGQIDDRLLSTCIKTNY